MPFDLTHLLVVFVAFLFGVALAWFMWKKVVGDQEHNNLLLVVLILLPIAVAFLFLGRFSELKVGPIEAKLREFASSKVRPDKIRPTEQKALEEFRQMFEARALMGIASPLVFITLSGDKALINNEEVKGSSEKFWKISASIQQAIYKDSFLALVLVDSNDRVIGYFLKDMFIDLLKLTPYVKASSGDNFYNKVNLARKQYLERNSELWLILQHPKVRVDMEGRHLTARSEATNAEAYKLMIEKEQDVIIVVDNEHRYVGVVTRKQIEADITLRTLDITAAH